MSFKSGFVAIVGNPNVGNHLYSTQFLIIIYLLLLINLKLQEIILKELLHLKIFK